MNGQKLQLIIAPLLCTILLSIIANLKTGKELNIFFTKIFSPFIIPVSLVKHSTSTKIATLKNIPNLQRQYREQKVLISYLIWQNENLKSSLQDQKTSDILKPNYQYTIPIEINGAVGKYLATTTQNTNDVINGLPIISDNILLGFTNEKINKNTIRINGLEDDQNPPISVHTASGQKGVYKYVKGSPQIINVPSQTPLILGDFILTDSSEHTPANLLIGKVVEIITTPQDPLQKAKIDLYDRLQNNPPNVAIIVKP